MNKPPLLVLDCHYLCHRAFHTSQRELSFRGQAIGIVFGFLQSISLLKDEFQTDRVAFCFEHPFLRRRSVFNDYKRNRTQKQRTPEEEKAYSSFILQIMQLRKTYLPNIGFENVFSFRGMESDDIMAAIAANTPKGEETIIVTADSDLLQCLRENVMVYSPQKQRLWTASLFEKEYGIRPSKWAVVKAMAGCHGDNVPGIPGVGEVTALKYLRGQLDPKSKAFQKIMSPEGKAIIRRNRRLVQLPFDGCPVPDICEDEVTVSKWRSVCASLGMRSIAGRPPIISRRTPKQ